MQWCEDMDMEPVLTVWDGKSYGGIIPAGEMQPYLVDILNELEVSISTQTVLHRQIEHSLSVLIIADSTC
jgi:alpha-N-arabinofuranosidase